MTWNQAWLTATGFANAEKFSPQGLIPPAITGLHNGDALRAWADSGITHAVGDNTRAALLNTVSVAACHVFGKFLLHKPFSTQISLT